jgi:hypothetical protein
MEEGNGTELASMSLSGEKEINQVDDDMVSIPDQEPRNKEKKSKSCGGSLTKRILIGTLLASQGIGLATDIIGMQESQQVSALVSPIVAYSTQDFYNRTPDSNCSSISEAGYLYPFPNYVRDESCNCGPHQNCDECILQTCPPGKEYITNFNAMYTSQIAAIGTRVATILGLLVGGILDYAIDLQ